MDKEQKRFNADLLESIRQMKRNERAAVHVPEQIKARRASFHSCIAWLYNRGAT